MAQVNTGIITPLFRKISEGFQKIFIPSDNIILDDDATVLQEMIDALSYDYVVEEGSNSNGEYRKWANGTLEMWGDFSRTAAINEKAGNIYSSSVQSITYPIQSTTQCKNTLTVTAGGAIWGKPWDSASGYLRDFSYTLLAATAWSSASYRITYYAKGTWK